MGIDLIFRYGQRLFLLLLAAVLSTLAFSLPACGNAGAQFGPAPTAIPATTLTITGAGGTTRVLEFLADAYRDQNSDLAFEFLSGSGSSGGVKGVLAGQMDLGAMSRPPKDSELADGIVHVGFAEDKVVVVTSPDIAITSLTGQQLRGIFTGAVTNWSEVGGPDTAIAVLIREEGDSNTRILRKGILGEADFGAGSAVITSEGDLKAALSNSTNTIGYLAYSGVRLESLPLNVLAIDGNHPANTSGSYPIDTRLLGVAYLPGNADNVQPFVDFITGPEARALLAQEGIASVD